MPIFGYFIWAIFGLLFILIAEKVYNGKVKDYTQYPCAKGQVFGTHDVYGQRWLVKFTDPAGDIVLAADDKLAKNVFNAQKYPMPRRGNIELVYFWPNSNQRSADSIYISGLPVNYTMHFCNEDFYKILNRKNKRNRVFFWLIGVGMILSSIVILICR